jgi:RHS repeat-associated protein
MRSWDDRNQRFSVTYDTLRRPVDRTVSVSGGAEKLLSRIVYGELLASPAATNHRGRVYRAYDGAGVATSLAFDFKGHALEEQRQLYDDKTIQPDWSALLGEDTIAEMATAAASLLGAETFSASSERDALGRVLTAISPDGSEVHYGYDEGGALQQVTLHHRGSLTEQTVVGDITYDAKGRREEVVYGPTGDPTSTTTYTYDELSQRLTRLRTVRDSDSAAIQSLHYHYDPVGNITDIRDTAQQTVYFDNTVVAAANSYTYDALYRLVEATGREHSSEGVAQRTHADMAATAQPMTSDPSAMRLYTQQYVYDEVGNILEMKHLPSSGTGWTRYYQYDELGNRLEATSASGDDPEGPYTHEYDYDDHGNMVAMPHLSSMIWNHDDELQEVTAGSETVYFQYAGGNRSRKYVEKPLSTTEERIYLGSFEIYRKRVSGTISVERESLHISDGTGRILLIETKTIDGGTPVTTPTGIWRYQLSNHIGSASTEITDEGDIISYEEYHPYGTTAYRAVDSSIDVSAKRYRYTGMERDEETGLSYHTARYYASWLGRWTASDPIGLGDGPNRYHYCHANPISLSDASGSGPPGSELPEGRFSELDTSPGSNFARHEGRGPSLFAPSGPEFHDFEADEVQGEVSSRAPSPKPLPKASTTSGEYSDVIDIQGASASTSKSDYGYLSRARESNLRYKREWEPKLRERRDSTAKMALGSMAAYLAAGFGGAALAEGGIVVAGFAPHALRTAGMAWTTGGRALGGRIIARTGPLAFTTAMAFAGAMMTEGEAGPIGRSFGRVFDKFARPAGGLRTADRLFSSSKYMGVESAPKELVEAVASRRGVYIAEPGSDDLRFLDSVGAEACAGGPNVDQIILRPNPSKAAVLEEFLHGTQHRLGIIERLGRAGAETHVKDFMIRHKRLLGLSAEDVRILQMLKDAGL